MWAWCAIATEASRENHQLHPAEVERMYWYLPPALVLWYCWLGRRRSIRPVKNMEWWDAGMVVCLYEVQMTCIWSGWCHCHPVISCFSKIQNGYHSGYRPTRVDQDKTPLSDCACPACAWVCFELLPVISDCVSWHRHTIDTVGWYTGAHIRPTTNLIQYNTIFVYYELSGRSSTRET